MAQLATSASRSDAILVVIDIQERLAAAMHRRESVIDRTRLLVRTAAIVGIPVLASRQYPKGLGPLEPAVIEVLDEAAEATSVETVDKLSFDCLSEPAFREALDRSGRKQLIVSGMETHICVVQTALAALRGGYDVHVAADACCSRDDEHHALALSRLAGAGAVVTTSESAAYELVGCAGTDEFKALLSAVKGG
jgi:nicotinamidase-related amidase